MKMTFRVIVSTLVILVTGFLVAAGGTFYVFGKYGRDLPDHEKLADYEPPIATRVYAGNGRLLQEFAREDRVFVPYEAIPKRVRNAFISAEDNAFYEHPGVDLPSIVRAAITNLRNLGTGRRPQGASTITQQVAENFLLDGKTTIEQKIREAILAFKIEQTYSKERILELYLNEIYLGRGSYGVAAAALTYFGKSLDDLSVAEAAYLAALPKGPNAYQIGDDQQAALRRRNWVIDRMAADGRISLKSAERAKKKPLRATGPRTKTAVDARYFEAEIRRRLIDRYDEDRLYEAGLTVYSTLNPELQRYAREALRGGLVSYDRRQGWRGPIATISVQDGAWRQALPAVAAPDGMPDDWQRAAVLGLREGDIRIGLPGGNKALIHEKGFAWTDAAEAREIVTPGDVVLVRERTDDPGYELMQMPEVNGAIMAMDPHTGRVLAMQGGFAFEQSKFNRATQARRQPGSAFKPFVYLSALENGYTPSTIVLDAPVTIEVNRHGKTWKPQNYSGDVHGPAPMRVGIEQSRNLMTVRLAQAVGMDKVAQTAEAFGVYKEAPTYPAAALGTAETRLFDMTAAYARIANGGENVDPHIVDRIQGRDGNLVYRHEKRNCPGCKFDLWLGQKPPKLPDPREQLSDPASVYQLIHLMKGVVKRGTAQRLRDMTHRVAAKTGTSNNNRDAWFMGYSPNLVAGVYVGYDDHRSLGPHAYGANTAGPIWESFMKKALDDRKPVPFKRPDGVHMVRVDLDTGERARPGDDNVILEAYKTGNWPADNRTVLDQHRIEQRGTSNASDKERSGTLGSVY